MDVDAVKMAVIEEITELERYDRAFGLIDGEREEAMKKEKAEGRV